ncbi:serine/arginine-rich splicing factor RS2Z33-like [Solanum stenotomum]|uniref:serine/arginine-rich splicing factor RS2Z33-like n=1 Tax=Solanum stenotomum TaxID=172797 RepID=UPI0020D16E8B|nr:serine/arginine-rich splicing factor RS2Z33-like [Solanum stenotomum]
MGVTSEEKVELAAFQLKGVAQIEEKKLKGRYREKKRFGDDDNSPHVRSDGHGHPKHRQRFSEQDSSNAPKYSEDRVSNPKPQGISSESLWPTCARCGKRHEGRCLAGMEGCFSCGESGHVIRNCPKMKAKGTNVKQFALSGSDANAPRKNRFYAHQARGEQEYPPDETISMCFMLY